MEDCIFCKIVSQDIPSVKIYEDELFLSFMDINPLGRGHCLLIPKEHYQDIFEMPENVLRDLAAFSKKLADSAKSGLNAHGVFIFQANGRAATQMVPHYHMHILPRFENDVVTMGSWELIPGDMDDINKSAEEIKKSLALNY